MCKIERDTIKISLQALAIYFLILLCDSFGGPVISIQNQILAVFMCCLRACVRVCIHRLKRLTDFLCIFWCCRIAETLFCLLTIWSHTATEFKTENNNYKELRLRNRCRCCNGALSHWILSIIFFWYIKPTFYLSRVCLCVSVRAWAHPFPISMRSMTERAY